MPTAIRTISTTCLFAMLLCISAGQADAARRRAIVGLPAPAVVPVAVPGGIAAAPAVVPMPVGSLATVRDFPGGVLYGGAYRIAEPVLAPAPPRAVRHIVRYGRSDFVGPRGFAAVVSPWPMVPVTTPSKPYGIGVVPPGEVVAWQSPAGYLYRANYQSAVLKGSAVPTCPLESGPVEIMSPNAIDGTLESIPVPPAEIGPEF